MAQHKLLTGLASLLVITGIGGAMSDRAGVEWIASAHAQDEVDEESTAAEESVDEADASADEATDESADQFAEESADPEGDADAPADDDSELAAFEDAGDAAVDDAEPVASEEAPAESTPVVEPPVVAPPPPVPPPAAAPTASEAQRRSELREFVGRSLHGQQIADNEDIFAAGLVNSLFAMQLVNFCETKYGKEFSPETFEISNFNSIDALVKTCAPG